MARVTIPINAVPANGATLDAVTFVAGDATNDHEMENDGATLLVVKNTDAAPHTTTVVSVSDPYGRTKDTTITTAAFSTPNDGISVAGPFLPAVWNQAGGKVYVDVTTATGMFYAGLRLSMAR